MEILKKTIIVGENSIPNSKVLLHNEVNVNFRASEIDFRIERGIGFRIYTYCNPTNCKLITIEGINSFGHYYECETPGTIILMNYVIESIKAYNSTFFVHVTSLNTITFLETHFEKVYVNKAFIRGVSTPQYHGCFMPKESYLVNNLKKYQDKKPHVIIKETITKKELLKLTNYKQEKRKKDFLEKLIKKYE